MGHFPGGYIDSLDHTAAPFNLMRFQSLAAHSYVDDDCLIVEQWPSSSQNLAVPEAGDMFQVKP